MNKFKVMISCVFLIWANATVYSAGDVVRYNGIDYYCDLGHTASMTITPTNTGYWSSLPYNYFAAGATTFASRCGLGRRGSLPFQRDRVRAGVAAESANGDTR